MIRPTGKSGFVILTTQVFFERSCRLHSIPRSVRLDSTSRHHNKGARRRSASCFHLDAHVGGSLPSSILLEPIDGGAMGGVERRSPLDVRRTRPFSSTSARPTSHSSTLAATVTRASTSTTPTATLPIPIPRRSRCCSTTADTYAHGCFPGPHSSSLSTRRHDARVDRSRSRAIARHAHLRVGRLQEPQWVCGRRSRRRDGRPVGDSSRERGPGDHR